MRHIHKYSSDLRACVLIRSPSLVILSGHSPGDSPPWGATASSAGAGAATAGRAPPWACLTLYRSSIPLSHLVDGRADVLVLPIIVQLHHAAQQHVACAAGLVGELASAREDRLDVGCRRRARRTPSAPPASGPGSACPAPSASPCARLAPALGTAGCARRRALAAPSGPVCTGHWGWRQIGTRKLQAVQVWGTCQPASATGSQWTFQCRGRARTASASLG